MEKVRRARQACSTATGRFLMQKQLTGGLVLVQQNVCGMENREQNNPT